MVALISGVLCACYGIALSFGGPVKDVSMSQFGNSDWQAAFVVAALCALAAAIVYRKARIRRHRRLLADERAEQALQGSSLSMSMLVGVLVQDIDFRRYMMSMMVFGSGDF